MVALKILNKPNLVRDWGTYASNAVASGNTNALKDALDNYTDVKEFFNINTDAFIVAATMNYFGMTSESTAPTKTPIPLEVKKGNAVVRREWLHQHISKLIDMYVTVGVSGIQGLVEGKQPQS